MLRAFSFLAAAIWLLPSCAVAQDVIHFEQPIKGIEAFRAQIDGHPGLFLFDSGVGVSVLTPATARAIDCMPWGKGTGFRAIGERVDEQRCNAATLVTGATSRRMPQMALPDLEHFMGPDGRRFAGAIGLDAFDGQTITLSVSTHALTVEDARSAERIARHETEVPIRLVRAAEGAALTADIGVTTRLGLLWMEIDTGNYGPSLVDKRAAPLLALDPSARGPGSLSATIGTGARFGGTAIVRDLIMDGDLGREALANWVVTLDLAHGRGWIRPAGEIAPWRACFRGSSAEMRDRVGICSTQPLRVGLETTGID